MILIISHLNSLGIMNKHKEFNNYEDLSDYLVGVFKLTYEELDNLYDGCTLYVGDNKWIYLADGEWLD